MAALGGFIWVALPGSVSATPGGSASPTPVGQYGTTGRPLTRLTLFGEEPKIGARLDAARNLAMEVDGLTPEEKDTLSKSLDDLVRDTPGTTVAATRFKRLATKAGGGAASAFKGILVSVVSETAKKILWP